MVAIKSIMNPNKARKILTDYAANGYNAKKTLIDNGYSESTANKISGEIIKRATRAVAKEVANMELVDIGKSQTKSAIEILGLTSGEVANTLKKIATNDRDYASALKVLRVLAKEIGVHLDEEETKTQPLLNITVESGKDNKEPDNITGHLSSNVVKYGEVEMGLTDGNSDVVVGEGDIGDEEGNG